MALNNIIASRQQVQNSQGKPVSGGKVFLYEPGTTTFITSYRDSGLVVAHSNPVRLSASGRANIWISRDCDMLITDRINPPTVPGNTVLTEDNVNPDALGTEASGGLVPNGSFEIDADADLIPDGWTLVNEAGSDNEIDATESTDGQNSFRFTSTGLGGGNLRTTDIFPVNDVDNLRVNFDIRSTVAAVRNIVRVEWLDITQVPISNTDVYDSTANPTAYTSQLTIAAPPANARFARLRLIGIDPSVLLAGSTFFDRINVFYPAVVSGVFDNITIQDNEIISTNTNGVIELTPDGTGRIEASRLSALTSSRIRADILTATPPVAELVTAILDFYDLDETTQIGRFGFNGNNTLALGNLMRGGPVTMDAVDAAGVQRTFLSGDPDAEVYLNPTDGIVEVRGDIAGSSPPVAADGTDARIDLRNSTGAELLGRLGFAVAGTLALSNQVRSGLISIAGLDAGGAMATMMLGSPVGNLQLFHPDTNAAIARSTTPVLGGLEVNNTLDGGGFERVATLAEGSFTANAYAGFSVDPDWDFEYQRIGRMVILSLAISSTAIGTSDDTVMQAENLPAAIRPTTSTVSSAILGGIDNGGNTAIRARISTAGVITFSVADGGVFTNSGNKGMATLTTIVYMLD